MTKTPTTHSRREPGLAVALIPLIAMGLLLGIGYGIYKIRPQVLLVAAAFLTGCLGFFLKFKWQDMERGIVDSIHKAMPAILIMLCVGILIGSWIAGGTIPMVIYYGLKLISPKFFLVTACFVCSLTSIATGTSWGTIGTLGVAFIGIAMGLGIPLGPAAGAIVAGAYFGDKMSPFSDVTNLAPVAAGSNLFDHIKHMMWSATPAWLLGMFVYFIVGLRYGSDSVHSDTLLLITSTLKTHFRFHVLLLLPMVIVFYFAATKKPTIPGMLLSSLAAGVLAVIFQKASIPDVATAMNTGYIAQTGVAQVDQLISRGGMMSMMETQLVAFTAFSFGGIMQKTGLLQIILDRVMKFADKVWSIVLTTIGASILTALVTGSSYLSMIIPGELLAPVFRKKNLAAKNLSRIVEESGAIIVPLIPWSMAGVYITGTIGVSTFSYLPWAIMNYVSVLILALFGFTGWTMAARKREDETQIGS
ncbi:MAG: Na+/H+ antiporter NhaC [Acidobacteria bacterium]|nr:Na+/H+ antiporter NhaC [Acidobacteriota bacterium]MCG2817036.1 Na+/H+ antiporter NhaC [Candidatus Aminicenantes bacterium]MBU1474515.1 Na+/H+ antiporter NhaC [Acidobacteriota bacterium]MBU4255114.1 Na+/H+ antiporter NhaC [Acidobacteriota bacterium]MBU4330988.1 Na+/H+ antiporter NhaC [Acidobacteriota bacterium]